MERLTEQQTTLLKKMATARLQNELMKAGYQQETVMAWSREDLLAAYAEVLLKAGPAGVVMEEPTTETDPDLERARMEH